MSEHAVMAHRYALLASKLVRHNSSISNLYLRRHNEVAVDVSHPQPHLGLCSHRGGLSEVGSMQSSKYLPRTSSGVLLAVSNRSSKVRGRLVVLDADTVATAAPSSVSEGSGEGVGEWAALRFRATFGFDTSLYARSALPAARSASLSRRSCSTSIRTLSDANVRPAI